MGGDSLFRALPTRMFSRACFPSTSKRLAMLSMRSGRKVPNVTVRPRKSEQIEIPSVSMYATYSSVKLAKGNKKRDVRV